MVNLLRRLGIDRAISYSILGTARGLMAGPLVALAIATYFTPALQGYFYTFANILALQLFAELGLGAVIIQFAAHEWAGLEKDARGHIIGDRARHARLASLLRFGVRWYGTAAFLLAAILLLGGTWFLGSQPVAGVVWKAPWVALAICACVRFTLSPVFFLLEGAGQLRSVYGYRLWDGTQMAAVTIVCVVGGAQLWTPAIVCAFGIVSSLAFFWRWHGTFIADLVTTARVSEVSWKSELLPLQWRIALSWMGGYFAFQLFVPVSFRYQGPEVAGQLGLTLSLINTVSSLAAAWVSTKIPTFGTLIAQRRWSDVDDLARRAVIGSCVVAIAGSLAALSALVALRAWQPQLADRFLDPVTATPFLMATVLLQVTLVQSAYLRGFKREPLLVISLCGGALVGLLTWTLGSRFGPMAMGLGYLGVMTFVSLPIYSLIFFRLRRQWRTEPMAPVIQQSVSLPS